MSDFDDFLTQRERASTAFVEGDVTPLRALSAESDPATIYPPNGTVVSGADAVNAGNAAGAASFSPGGSNAFEIQHSGHDGDLGYWTGIQRSRVRVDPDAPPVPMDLRVTELFRRVDGHWVLFHRHADRLSDGA